jgi:hypothetical protein
VIRLSESCEWLHKQLEPLPLIKYPFNPKELPENGIYFFYEKGENWGHGGTKHRVVRVGTSKDGNLRKRLAEHFLLDEGKMNFDAFKPAPRERSIFRKNIGRALIKQRKDDYLKIWEIDFTSHKSREENAHLRDVAKEKELETEITSLLRANFSFKVIELAGQAQRMDKTGLESALIGTLARCPLCQPSTNWLGRYSPKTEISNGKLWLIQHLNAKPIDEQDKATILKAISTTHLQSSLQ